MKNRQKRNRKRSVLVLVFLSTIKKPTNTKNKLKLLKTNKIKYECTIGCIFFVSLLLRFTNPVP